MRKLILLLLLVSNLAAHSQRLDSLKMALSNARNDIDKAELLNAVAAEYRQTDPKTMLSYAQQALTLSRKIKHTLAEGNALLLQTALRNDSQVKIDISDRQSGIYFLKVISEKGTGIEKIVKK